MELGDDDIREFADLWKQEFGETLSQGDARYHASQLMELYAALARPLEEARPESRQAEPTTPHP